MGKQAAPKEADYSALMPRVGQSPELTAIDAAHARRDAQDDLLDALKACNRVLEGHLLSPAFNPLRVKVRAALAKAAGLA